ncbi:hypothetical protein EUGRSUZ_E03070 [Eucalyptus grandis]|nr:hypothetical protein EUGRSUZ_E03070 [Eucalyptus grandis]
MCSKVMQTCDSCSLIFPRRSMKKMEGPSGEAQILCRHCAKLLKSKQYCGICKKIWHHSDDGDWVCCDGCNVCLHADCANISSRLLKELRHSDYYCLDWRPRPLAKGQTYRNWSQKRSWWKTSKLLCLTRFLWCAMAWKGHIFQNFI